MSMSKSSAPGKVILFGEHAVVYGETAVAVAVDRRIHMDIEKRVEVTRINGLEIDPEKQPYIVDAIERVGIKEPLEIKSKSYLPSGAGMGSSAALTVSTLGCLYSLEGTPSYEKIARTAFEIEHSVQGGASPIDTSTSTHGSAVKLTRKKGSNHLWKIKKDEKRWHVHHQDIPKMKLVVGDTGIHAPTGPLVRKVRRFYDKSGFARDIISEIGELAERGCEALEEGDLESVGSLMNDNHRLLTILGVGHPKLDELVNAVSSHCYGAKLSGAGGGGIMIALTDKPRKVAEIIKERDGTPYMLEASTTGLTLE